MFELKFKLTDADVKAVNTRLMWSYFIPYLIVSLIGLAAGIAAAVLKPRTEILVLGIVLIVLSAILLGCSVMLVIAPKNFVHSVLFPDNDVEREVIADDGGITVKTPEQSDITVSYGGVLRVKKAGEYVLVYGDKDSALIIKNAVTSGQSLDDFYEFLKSKTSAKRAAAPTATNNGDAQKTDSDNADSAQKPESESVDGE